MLVLLLVAMAFSTAPQPVPPLIGSLVFHQRPLRIAPALLLPPPTTLSQRKQGQSCSRTPARSPRHRAEFERLGPNGHARPAGYPPCSAAFDKITRVEETTESGKSRRRRLVEAFRDANVKSSGNENVQRISGNQSVVTAFRQALARLSPRLRTRTDPRGFMPFWRSLTRPCAGRQEITGLNSTAAVDGTWQNRRSTQDDKRSTR